MLRFKKKMYKSTGGIGGKNGGLHCGIRGKKGVVQEAVVERLVKYRGLYGGLVELTGYGGRLEKSSKVQGELLEEQGA